MIPRVLHCIWLSGERKGLIARKCIRSWKRCAPNYEIKMWGREDFDFSKMPAWVTESLSARKWAFACDYLRLDVLRREGGIYLDSDVFMLTSPDSFLKHDFFTGIERYPEICGPYLPQINANGDTELADVPGFALQAAIMGSIPDHPFISACIKAYETMHFILPGGSFNTTVLAPGIQARCARKFGFKFVDRTQSLSSGMAVYASDIFAGGVRQSTENSAMIHLCSSSWQKMSIWSRAHLCLQKTMALKSIMGARR